MDSYALGFRDRSSRGSTLGHRQIHFNSSLKTPPPKDDESKNDEIIPETNDVQDQVEKQDDATPTITESPSEKSDPETESSKEETGTGINGSSEST